MVCRIHKASLNFSGWDGLEETKKIQSQEASIVVPEASHTSLPAATGSKPQKLRRILPETRAGCPREMRWFVWNVGGNMETGWWVVNLLMFCQKRRIHIIRMYIYIYIYVVNKYFEIIHIYIYMYVCMYVYIYIYSTVHTVTVYGQM